ncbi:MAG: hypothetical protein B6I26_08645 [Desulfobacteraceae bacterium 4572_130]|nr:MAG: hypothetical protein B6I26_08645 [Desulfobacteraceae bacterium 4572_130]
MPIHEYKCNNCENNFEKLILGKEIPICPECNSDNLETCISMCSFVTNSSKGNSNQTSPSMPASSCTGCSATSCSTCS